MKRAGVACFWLERTERVEVALRRFVYASDAKCPGPYGYHNASVVIYPDVPAAEWLTQRDDGIVENLRPLSEILPDSRWPTKCEGCDYEFTPEDKYQVGVNPLYAGATNGRLYTMRNAPVGAMYDADWLNGLEMFTGPDGIALTVRTPGGDWTVDGEASNCTRTQFGPKVIEGQRHEKVWLGRTHYCWIRHGDPRKPATLHVDKNGNTCSAGAGSIAIGNYHGFLHHGQLTNA